MPLLRLADAFMLLQATRVMDLWHPYCPICSLAP